MAVGTQRRLAAIVAADVVGYSRLMRADEEGTLRALKAVRRDLVDPKIAEHNGRIVKTTGDGMLLEFASVLDAVRCCVEIQQAMSEKPSNVPEDRRLLFRVGVNIGDIIIDDSDIFGDGVNVAARLEGLAAPGGICISAMVYEGIRDHIDLSFVDLGEQEVKNISRPIQVWQVIPSIHSNAEAAAPDISQEIRFCVAADETTIAYGMAGSGPPVLKAPGFMSHLEFDWESPTWGPFFRAMASRCRLVRFDQRGNGLSDRNPRDISLETFVQDTEAVADAAGLERFAIYGASQGAAVAITYAVRHPERVSALILHGGYSRGRLNRSEMTEDAKHGQEALLTLIRTGWGQDNPAFRQMFSTLFIPSASTALMNSFNELMRVSTAPDIAARIMEVNAHIDVTQLLGQIEAPTLIFHGREDAVAPIEEGRRLAARIPNSKFIELDTANHITIHNEPAMLQVIEGMEQFLAKHASEAVAD